MYYVVIPKRALGIQEHVVDNDNNIPSVAFRKFVTFVLSLFKAEQ